MHFTTFSQVNDAVLLNSNAETSEISIPNILHKGESEEKSPLRLDIDQSLNMFDLGIDDNNSSRKINNESTFGNDAINFQELKGNIESIVLNADGEVTSQINMSSLEEFKNAPKNVVVSKRDCRNYLNDANAEIPENIKNCMIAKDDRASVDKVKLYDIGKGISLRKNAKCMHYPANFPPSLQLNECLICLNFFSNDSFVEQPLRNDSEDGLFHCTECPKSYKRLFCLKRHFQQKHSSKNPKQNEVFNHLSLSRVLNKKLKLYISEENGTESETKNDSEPASVNHYKSVSRKKLLTCGVPVKMAYSTSNTTVSKTKKPVKQESYEQKKASISFKTFKKRSHYVEDKIHNKNDIAGECLICLKSSVHSCNLHKRSKPIFRSEAIKMYKCYICPQVYSTEECIQKHQQIHLNAEKLHCHLCSKTFIEVKALEDHRRLHFKEEPYECQFCFRRFLYPQTLNLHERAHIDLAGNMDDQGRQSFFRFPEDVQTSNALECSICRRTFATAKGLILHLISHQKQKPL